MSEGLSIVIPTLGREQVLLETIEALLGLCRDTDEILLIDQTEMHEDATTQRLLKWEKCGDIRWIRLERPSITRAMNHGMRVASNSLILFLDDDIRPHTDLLTAHSKAHEIDGDLWATVGQVIQPWQSPQDIEPPRQLDGLRRDEDFPFHSTRKSEVQNVMAGNLCVKKELAESIKGFDENFQGSAYRFETEFARRVGKAGGRIQFLGEGGIDHLRVSSGGTRTNGSHLTSASPRHGVGDHYFALLHAGSAAEAHAYCIRRVFREVRTKFHLTHPWWIPIKLIGEIRAYFEARRLIAGEAG
ncbi:MAG: glycosyltransferase [Planctomycetota bacterium]